METPESNPLKPLPFRFVPVDEGPGRPKRATVDILKTQLWVFTVMHRSGWTVYRLEREFHPEQVKQTAGKISRPKRWDRYRDGKMVLHDRPGPANLIDRVEAQFPGTARWFRHPIWRALSDEPLKEEQIVLGLKQLEPSIRRWVLTNRLPDGRQRSHRVPTFPQETRRRLIRRGSFDALGAAVLMVRYSEVKALSELRTQALKVYYAIQPKLVEHPYLTPFYPRLFSLVDFYCRQWIFFDHDPALRMEAILNWQGFRDHIWGSAKPAAGARAGMPADQDD